MYSRIPFLAAEDLVPRFLVFSVVPSPSVNVSGRGPRSTNYARFAATHTRARTLYKHLASGIYLQLLGARNKSEWAESRERKCGRPAGKKAKRKERKDAEVSMFISRSTVRRTERTGATIEILRVLYDVTLKGAGSVESISFPVPSYLTRMLQF